MKSTTKERAPTTQVGFARPIIGRFHEFISLGDSKSPVTDPEVGKGAGALYSCRVTNPGHGQGAFLQAGALEMCRASSLFLLFRANLQ